MSLFKSITAVKVLGVRTGEQTKQNGTENFSVYNILITYSDGTTKTEELAPSQSYSDKQRYKELMTYIDKEQNAEKNQIISQSVIVEQSNNEDPLDELKKLKELFDMGVIPEDTYEIQRDQYLAQLKTTPYKPKNNISIIRTTTKQLGEARVYIYINGEKKGKVDSNFEMNLIPGQYSIYFKRALFETNHIDLFVEANKSYMIKVHTSLVFRASLM